MKYYKKEKKELANKKRLEALKEKQERNKQAKQQIKIDLINIDSTVNLYYIILNYIILCSYYIRILQKI